MEWSSEGMLSISLGDNNKEERRLEKKAALTRFKFSKEILEFFKKDDLKINDFFKIS